MHKMRVVYQTENFKVITYLLSAKGPESQCLKHFKIRHYRPKECMPLTYNKFANIYVKLLFICYSFRLRSITVVLLTLALLNLLKGKV